MNTACAITLNCWVFLGEVGGLGPKLGPLLVQLPPSLRFDFPVAHNFFSTLREYSRGEVVCEPRHMAWYGADAQQFLQDFQVARVAADPSLLPQAAEPGGWDRLVYYRLHGSPRIYYSKYPKEYLDVIIHKLRTAAERAAVWCIFDNTAEGAATGNALDVLQRTSTNSNR